jgi:hypothetical protein
LLRFYEKFHADNTTTIKSLLTTENWALCPGIGANYSILEIRVCQSGVEFGVE